MHQIINIEPIENRRTLLLLKNESRLGIGINVVYVYFLLNRLISYPKGDSNILYIGEAMREAKATGVRFGQHLSPSSTTGADAGSNFTLSQYFHAKWPIGLSIFKTDEDRVDRERDLIYAHISYFGAPPIAQGKIPNDLDGRNRTVHIASFVKNNDELIVPALNVLLEIVAKSIAHPSGNETRGP